MYNKDVKWMKYQFTPEQIAQAADTFDQTRAYLDFHGWSPWGGKGYGTHSGGPRDLIPRDLIPRDLIGTIRFTTKATGTFSSMNSPELVAETILTHFLGINIFAWEDRTAQTYPPSRIGEAVPAMLTELTTWLRSDTFTGGTHGPADSEEEARQESTSVGAH